MALLYLAVFIFLLSSSLVLCILVIYAMNTRLVISVMFKILGITIILDAPYSDKFIPGMLASLKKLGKHLGPLSLTWHIKEKSMFKLTIVKITYWTLTIFSALIPFLLAAFFLSFIN